MAGLIFNLGFIPGTKDVSTSLLPTVLQAGVFFCGWVYPLRRRAGLNDKNESVPSSSVRKNAHP